MNKQTALLTTVFETADLSRLKQVAKSEGLRPSTWLRNLALREINAREQRQTMAAA